MSLVSIVHSKSCLTFKRSIEKSIDLINFGLDRKIDKIIIKPNMCYYWDYSIGETTNPKFVAELVDFLREHVTSTPEICIVESDASAMKCKYAFKMLGYEKIAKEKKVRLVNLSGDATKEIEVKMLNNLYRFRIPETIRNADLFINVPKIKYHLLTKFSCALKNIYGCNPYPKKFKYHPYLDEVIVSLNKLMKPDLCLVDGTIVHGEHIRKLGLIMASTNPVAIDSVAAKIVGLNPKKIRHLVLAEREGLGRMEYKTVGLKIRYFARRFPRRDPRENMKSTIINFGALAFQMWKEAEKIFIKLLRTG